MIGIGQCEKKTVIHDNRGFTLMELVVTITIMATLGAFAIPRMLKTQSEAHATKSLDNINTIGRAILAGYNGVAAEGDAGGNAIARFSIPVNTVFDTAGVIGPEIISFGPDGSGSITVLDLFQTGGPPSSPFDKRFYIVSAVTPGTGTWISIGRIPKLDINPRPSITVADQSHPMIRATFSP